MTKRTGFKARFLLMPLWVLISLSASVANFMVMQVHITPFGYSIPSLFLHYFILAGSSITIFFLLCSLIAFVGALNGLYRELTKIED